MSGMKVGCGVVMSRVSEKGRICGRDIREGGGEVGSVVCG